jgi:hypothetical protein
MCLGVHRLVAGRVDNDGILPGSFAWITQYPLCDDLAYMKAALEGNGWAPQSHVTVLADGADGAEQPRMRITALNSERRVGSLNRTVSSVFELGFSHLDSHTSTSLGIFYVQAEVHAVLVLLCYKVCSPNLIIASP